MKFRDGKSPRVIGDGAARLEIAMLKVCQCGGESCQITKRMIGLNWTVCLQCDTCGRNFAGSSFKKAFFPTWECFPEWDQSIIDRWDEKQREVWEERRRIFDQEFQQRQAGTKAAKEAWEQRRRDYAQWCKTSLEWAAMRSAVILRANSTCEACLERPAITAHHLTYAYGKLPPAWELRAVCRECHERLHADVFGDVDEWAPRTFLPTCEQ